VLQVNTEERGERQRLRRPDLSQCGNRENLRNEALDGQPFVYRTGWTVPLRGTLEFDYVSPLYLRPDGQQQAGGAGGAGGGGGVGGEGGEGEGGQQEQQQEQQDQQDQKQEQEQAQLSQQLLRESQRHQHRQTQRQTQKQQLKLQQQSLQQQQQQIAPLKRRNVPAASGDRFNAFLRQHVSLSRPPTPDAEHLATLKAVWRTFDIDEDGRITPAELRRALRLLHHHPSKTELRHVMTRFDMDGDGTIDFGEFLALWRELQLSVLRGMRLLAIRHAAASDGLYFSAVQVRQRAGVSVRRAPSAFLAAHFRAPACSRAACRCARSWSPSRASTTRWRSPPCCSRAWRTWRTSTWCWTACPAPRACACSTAWARCTSSTR
jgi:hypothetical protein